MNNLQTPNASELLANRFIEARQKGHLVGDIDPPTSLDEAMEVQWRVADALGERIGGWKVGLNPALGAVVAPMFASACLDAPAEWRWAHGLFVEIEIAGRLIQDLPNKTYSREEMIAAFDGMTLGVELVASRLARGGTGPYTTYVADNIGNLGFVISKECQIWRDIEFPTRLCSARLDGQLLYEAPALHPQDNPLIPLVAAADAQNDRLGGFRKGQIVTTGSLCGMIAVPGPGTLTLALAGFESIEIMLTAQ